jgi:hypothetical protein
MFLCEGLAPSGREGTSFERLVRRLSETFVVRDVMVPLNEIKPVKPGALQRATEIIKTDRYSVVPVSDDGKTFYSVFCADHESEGSGSIAKEREVVVSDHIADSTSLPEAFLLFGDREWYLTLHANRVSGLITYWAFNSREFRVYLYTGLSRVEELSRDLLARDGCGITNGNGLNLTPEALEKIQRRIGPMWRDNGGNRFVDELDYYQIASALRKHQPWRKFLIDKLGGDISNCEYSRRFDFTDLRDSVMHGRTLFPTYNEFVSSSVKIRKIGELIIYLDAYLAKPPERTLLMPVDSDTTPTSV